MQEKLLRRRHKRTLNFEKIPMSLVFEESRLKTLVGEELRKKKQELSYTCDGN